MICSGKEVCRYCGGVAKELHEIYAYTGQTSPDCGSAVFVEQPLPFCDRACALGYQRDKGPKKVKGDR
jgi:hypothetical protein